MTDNISKLTDALGVLVDALQRHRSEVEGAMLKAERQPLKRTHLKPIDLAQVDIAGLCTDPVENALRSGIKRIGQKIWDIGDGRVSLVKAIDDVTAREDAKGIGTGGQVDYWLHSIMNGVGEGQNRFWA